MNTFDRYLLARYLHVAMVFVIASLGLFVVVDGFMNLDEHQQNAAGKGSLGLLLFMGEHYLYRSADILDLAGPTIMVLSAMSALALMLKSGEIHPLLAAGVPTYRLTLSLIIGMFLVNVLLIANQELVLPAIAPHLQADRGRKASDAQEVQPQYDSRRVYIAGTGIIPLKRELQNPEFVLPQPELATSRLSIRAQTATYFPPGADPRGGWLLKGITSPVDDNLLTAEGRELIIPQRGGTDLFIVSSLPMDQLVRHAANHRLVKTTDLFRRLQQPTGSLFSRRSLLVHLHGRLTRPLLAIIGLYVVIPLIIRRERMSVMQQVTNIAVCAAVLGGVFGISLGAQFLGQSGLLKPEQAVWGPLIFGGGVASWLSGIVRT
ncbi:LptF/LptG family permease [Planctomicrobium sp. SH664]|uniref:LptF/LptG family permease n=1 Tax=Planctomicrobium sp. SH664 TaxID=3448125 RepID=UPI003F5B9DD3